MTSMQDALTEALEHPIEPRKHHSNKPHKSHRVVVKRHDENTRAFLWGAIGSFIGAALVYRVGKAVFSRH